MTAFIWPTVYVTLCVRHSPDVNASWPGGNSSTVAAGRPAGRRYELCDPAEDATAADTEDDCEARRGSSTRFSEGAVALFVVSQLMLGMSLSPSSSLTMTYMDDNARDQSPKYFGTTRIRSADYGRPSARNETHTHTLWIAR